MKLVERFWTAVSYLGSILTLSPFHDPSLQQNTLSTKVQTPSVNFAVPWPRFYPPSGVEDGFPSDDFYCDYPSMMGWEACVQDTAQCWLRNPKTGFQYNITTDYELYAPKGILRKYSLDLKDGEWDADGINFKTAKLFNEQYPGPWLQACWGDEIEVTVKNYLKYNGTSLHWHGVRMNQTMHMDGVNGVSQCPTAPGDSFVYKFKAAQYGTSWYHSHYSLQYADGALGPLTFHGPTVEDYDHAKRPLLMTDWYHTTAFWAITQDNVTETAQKTKPSILINGRGDARRSGWTLDTKPWPTWNITFEKRQDYKKPKRYLLRLINTSFDTTFIFSIDNHVMQVVEADFVPIHAYQATSVLVGIGQRYHVIVIADPVAYAENKLPSDGNFWIRTFVAECFRGYFKRPDGYERAAIVRYDPKSTANPQTTSWGNINFNCSDEPPERIRPIHPWFVGKPANGNANWGEEFDIVGYNSSTDKIPEHYPLAFFSLGDWNDWNPMRVDYEHPIFLDLHNYTKVWPKEWSVISEDHGPEDWIYIVIDGTERTSFNAHPFHLHGHDFALVQSEAGVKWNEATWHPKLNNPARRDVVLLPTDGYVVLAFKADNPGSWLLHCHIAAHASEGLGFQIMERQKAADKMWPVDGAAQKYVEEKCVTWRKWVLNKDHWNMPEIFQDDSGI